MTKTDLHSKKPSFLGHMLFTLVLCLGVLLAGESQTACTPTQGQQAKTVVMDVAMVACLILNAELSDARVAEVCQVSNALLPDVLNILAQQRQATALAGERLANQRMGASRDGGAPVPCVPCDAGRDAK